MTPPERLMAAAAPVLAAAPPGPVGVAVSGGGDSTALLLLLAAWGRASGRTIRAVTVDHRLRPESADEADAVAALCAAHGLPHTTLAWHGWDGAGNLQAAARDARRRLIAGWAGEAGVGAVALGHTRDDQAETLLMRLARGSGVDGLAAMAPVRRERDLVWLRPLLGVPRAALRAWLAAAGTGWAEDPGNTDGRFDRVRARAALDALAGLGIDAAGLAATAARLGRARAALEAAALAHARDCLAPAVLGEIVLDPARLAEAAAEIRLRVLAGALLWVSGRVYRPRLAGLEALLAAVESGGLGGGRTLHGCVLRPRRGAVVIRREPAGVAPPVAAEAAWDGRWRLAEPPAEAGLRLGALGAAGLARSPRWRETGAAFETACGAPALWRGAALVAAPLPGMAGAVAFRRVPPVFDPWDATLLR